MPKASTLVLSGDGSFWGGFMSGRSCIRRIGRSGPGELSRLYGARKIARAIQECLWRSQS